MKTALAIRQGGTHDYDQVRALIAETFAFHQQAMPAFFRGTATPPPSRQFVEDLLKDGHGALLIAQDRDDIVGFLTIGVRQSPDLPHLVQGRWAVVDNLGVRADRRRDGIGRQLMAAAQRWARLQGASRVQLNVWEFNAGAIAFYESLGYESVSRQLWKAL